MYGTVAETARRWGISERRVRLLCAQGRVPGAIREGRSWLIPAEAVKPLDARRRDLPGLLEVVHQKRAQLDALRPLGKGELERLMQEFVVEFTYNSNAIEGNTLTMHETDLVLRGITVGEKPLKDHLEAVGNRDAFEYVRELVADEVPLSQRVVREIHQLVLADKPRERGIYRSIPVRIAGALQQPVEPAEIEAAMERLLAWYHADEADPVVKAAAFHVEFEAIHPFVDGNGRTGRLIANLELMKAGYPPIDIKFADRAQYHAAFDAYHSGSDPRAMLHLFARYLDERLTHYLEIVAV